MELNSHGTMETEESVIKETCWRVGNHWCLQNPVRNWSVSQSWKSLGSWVAEEVMQPFKLKSLVSAPLIVSSLVASSGVQRKEFDVFDYIDPLIGTINGGEWSNCL